MDDSSDTPTQELASTPQQPASIEQIGGGRYQVLEVIGSGGAGVVYKAKDTSLDKIVAIKKLHNSASQSQSVRFHREAKILAALKHPNVMSAIDFGLTETNEPYLVLDYVHGISLAQWLKRNGAMPVPLAIATFIDIAQGLLHAHRKNIIHRDMKPSNVMLVEDEESNKAVRAQIVDFGLARDSETNQNFTTPGVGIGTPKYMSPEQIQGAEVDPRTDIYSFGCLMFEVLTGTPPFIGDTAMETLSMHLKDTPDTVQKRAQDVGVSFDPELPPGVESLVQKCLSKRPEERIKNGEELLAALQEQQSALLPKISPEADLPKARKRWISRNEVIIIVILLMVLPLVTVGLIQALSIHKEKKPTDNFFETNGISDDHPFGAKVSEDMLEKMEHPSNKYDSLSDNESLLNLLSQKKKIHSLQLSQSSITPSDLRLLRKRSDVRWLKIEADKQFLDEIAEIPSLQKLEILAPPVAPTYTSLDKLAKLPKLEHLTFKDCVFGKDAFRSLPKYRGLKHLTLTNCMGLKGDTLAPLQKCKKLYYLSLHTSEVDDSTLRSMPHLLVDTLKLTECDEVTNHGIKSLVSMPNLVNLQILEPKHDYASGITSLKKERESLQLPSFTKMQVGKKYYVGSADSVTEHR